MSSTVKTAILWIIIIMLVYLLWQLFDTASPGGRPIDWRLWAAAAVAYMLLTWLFRSRSGIQRIFVTMLTAILERLTRRPADVETLSDRLLRKRLRAFLISLAALVLATLAIGLPMLRDGETRPIAQLWVLAVVIVTAVVNITSLAYRIRSGRFGDAEYEIRELLTFLLSTRDNDDFRGPRGKPRAILRPCAHENSIWVADASGAER